VARLTDLHRHRAGRDQERFPQKGYSQSIDINLIGGSDGFASVQLQRYTWPKQTWFIPQSCTRRTNTAPDPMNTTAQE
jgi:hypothetical protein